MRTFCKKDQRKRGISQWNTNDYLDFNGTHLKIPDLVLGKVIPDVGQVPNYRSLLGEQQALLQEISDHTQSLAELRRIADAASERAEIARQQAVSAQEQARKAEKDALFSKIVAIVSLAASIIIPLVT